jgi:hypothetical protein
MISEKSLECADCGARSPAEPDARTMRATALKKGWMVGLRGVGIQHVIGWEDDYCPDCKGKHPRNYCSFTEKDKGQCTSRGKFVLQGDDDIPLHACGKHFLEIAKEMIRGGRTARLREAE